MAAHNWAPLRALDRESVILFGGGTGAGAADLTAIKGIGVTSITRTGAGLYTITLKDKYNSFLYLGGQVIDPTAPDDWEVNVVSEAVLASKTIAIAVYKGGVAADLTADEKLKLFIALSNTAQSPTGR
jgi:hypothetical protein